MLSILKGLFGELKVRLYLLFYLAFGYKRLHNVTIKLSNGGTSQIDHIILCRKGIFVIETKNYSGTIKVLEFNKYWTQTLGRQTYRLYNPIRQNEGHLSALRYLLKSKQYPMHNKVVFVGSAKLSGQIPKNVHPNILHLVSSIKKHPNVLSYDEVKQITRKIKRRKLPNNPITTKRHKNYVKSKINGNSRNT